jgi:hypothetical protein
VVRCSRHADNLFLFITHEKEINNLSIQELRLRRHYQNDLAELKELQTRRAQREKKAKTVDPIAANLATSVSKPEIGFEFSSHAPQPFGSALDGIPLHEKRRNAA